LFAGAIVSSIVIGLTIKVLNQPTPEMLAQGITNAIGTEKFPAPQATLLSTLDIGIQSQKLDWQFIFVGVFLAVVMELCGIKSLSFAVGTYLPLSTTLPIFVGGAIKGLVDRREKKLNIQKSAEEQELGKGNLFATGLVAGGAIAGVIIAFVGASSGGQRFLKGVSLEKDISGSGGLGTNGYFLLGTLFFAVMAFILWKTATGKKKLQ
jgi:uncharacterized oligopeptide transporter (OPT) family protein